MEDPWPDEPTIQFSDDFEPVVVIHLPREPVSTRAAGRKKGRLQAELRDLTKRVPWTYTGDVAIEIEWTVHLRWRCESDRAVDVDNIVKPILHGIAGTDGVLIDDTQVNHISVNWITWARADRQHLKIQLSSLDPQMYDTRGFSLVEVRPPLCLPLPALDEEGRRLLWSMLEKHRRARPTSGHGVGWDQARVVLPGQRLFHSSSRVTSATSPDTTSPP
jgi:Holliday junction resolvase RusA-like endonuclease